MKKVCSGFIADEGCAFVLTAKGYQSTPDAVKPERTIGEPVPGFAKKVPHSWIEKCYVEERPDERGDCK